MLFFLGAFGYFEVTHDITKYCKAKVFEKVGKKTPIAVRFSTVGECIEIKPSSYVLYVQLESKKGVRTSQ